MFLVYNSDIILAADFSLPITDRAFQYGDGLFETIRYENGRVWFWPDHVNRLSAGMAALHLSAPADFSANTLHETLLQLLTANSLVNQYARIKIQVWRQTGGLYTPTNRGANVLITAQPGNQFSIAGRAKIGIYDKLCLSYSPISAFKTLNALPYVLAGIARQAGGYDDMVLLDGAGNLAECIASNLFWYHDQTLYTPSVRTGCVNGIARRNLLQTAPTLGLTVSEGLYPPSVLQSADLVFCANAFGVQWFQEVNDRFSTDVLSADNRTVLDSLFAQFQG